MSIKTLSLEQFALYYGIEEPVVKPIQREMQRKRTNVYQVYTDEIKAMLVEGATVADIHRVINRKYELSYTVEVLRRLVHWKLKNDMPKGRRWANQHGVCK